jgi:spore germination protein YaaH
VETHIKRDATEATVIATVKQRGIPVSQPFGDNERYDLLVETPDQRILRVQVKTGWVRNGKIEFHGRSQHTNAQGNSYEKYEGDVDYFFVYTPDRDSLHVVGEWEFESSMRLRVEEPEQAHQTINWAEEYEFKTWWPPSPDDRDACTGDAILDTVVTALKQRNVAFARSVTLDGCDLFVERDDGAILRVAVETGWMQNGCVSVTRPARVDDSLDWFAVYAPAVETIYLIAANEFDQSISLRIADDVQRRSTINWASDYELSERAGRLR